MSVRLDTLGSHPRASAPASGWMRRRVEEKLARAGLTLDGEMPWDPQIIRPRVFRRLMLHGTLGAGEAYMDGDWECEALDEFTSRLVGADVDRRLTSRPMLLFEELGARLVNWQTRGRARAEIRTHYDFDEDLYTIMLGPTRTYSCGYWRQAATLEEAQNAKHDLICRKMGLRAGMRVLDVGCGWGGFAQYAATHYEVEVVGVTISAAQAEWARRACAGLNVQIRQADYRDVDGTFDRVVSVGMFEHVGPLNYRTYFDTIKRLTAPTGLFLLHTIGGSESAHVGDSWMNRYIFPHAVLPSVAQIGRAIEGQFILEDWHNFGADYDRTLRAWYANLEAAESDITSRHGNRFGRLLRYYLLTCAGLFRARRNHLWQLVLSPHGVAGGYRRVGC